MKKVLVLLFVALCSVSFNSCSEDTDCWTFNVSTKTGSKTVKSTIERCDLTEKEAELYRKFLEGEDKSGNTKSTSTVTKERSK
jgi:hypothetical protein